MAGTQTGIDPLQKTAIPLSKNTNVWKYINMNVFFRIPFVGYLTSSSDEVAGTIFSLPTASTVVNIGKPMKHGFQDIRDQTMTDKGH